MTAGGAVWSQASDLAGKCFNGTLCPAPAAGAVGLTRAPDLARGACPVGRYCPAGSSVATVCPAGTVQPVTGQDALNDCQVCTAIAITTGATVTTANAGATAAATVTTLMSLLLPLRLLLKLLVLVLLLLSVLLL
jgi:hypothetical protein